MFRYGRTSGIMAVVLLVLGVIPIVMAFVMIPQMPEMVATKFSATGEATQWGSRYDLFFIPALAFLLSVATYLTAQRQARAAEDTPTFAALTYRRYLRNGLVTAVILSGFSIYSLITTSLGIHPLPF